MHQMLVIYKKKSVDCVNAKKYLNKKRYVNYAADNIQNCDTYKAIWEQCVSGDTSYPWKLNPPLNVVRN